jgi:hypothetical protein
MLVQTLTQLLSRIREAWLKEAAAGPFVLHANSNYSQRQTYLWTLAGNSGRIQTPSIVSRQEINPSPQKRLFGVGPSHLGMWISRPSLVVSILPLSVMPEPFTRDCCCVFSSQQ